MLRLRYKGQRLTTIVVRLFYRRFRWQSGLVHGGCIRLGCPEGKVARVRWVKNEQARS